MALRPRVVAFAGLAALATLEWQRLVAGAAPLRLAVLVAVAVLAGVAVGRAGRARWAASPRRRGVLLTLASAAGVAGGAVCSGVPLRLLAPWHWDELWPGLAGGMAALGTVRLPYAAADPWPRLALELVGAELLLLAALIAFWPRRGGARGLPFVALGVLLVLVASPVVSLGGARPVAFGLVLAVLSVGFLWLERLPLGRSGLGIAGLVGVALAGALPLAAAADRGEAWFDYRAFAEGLGPDRPELFNWTQGYGPITWPRNGNEVMRVHSDKPLYWKVRTLDVFDGSGWRSRVTPAPRAPGDPSWAADVPDSWGDRPAWTNTIEVSVRRMATSAIAGAGTTMSVTDASRSVRPGLASGTWDTLGALRRGDSYEAKAYVPQPSGDELSGAASGAFGHQADDRVLTLALRPGQHAPGLRGRAREVHSAELHVPAWVESAAGARPYVEYPEIGRSDFAADRVLRRTGFARTWRLAQRLRRGARSPYDYLLRIDRYLSGPEFHYSERPPAVPPGKEALDVFLNDTHEGYCQHYAGAMALLLRMGGVPARVAAGFSPGGFSKRRDAWIVRDTDAHAWTEVWFDRYGWVTFDTTPDATPARSQIAVLELPAAGPGGLAGAGGAGGAGATGAGGAAAADGGRPGSGTHALRTDLLRDPGGTTGSVDAARGGGLAWWGWALGGLGSLALVLTFGALGALLVSRRAARSAGAAWTPVDAAIAELETALRRTGRPLATGTTLRSLEGTLGGTPAARAYLRALAAGRYSGTVPAGGLTAAGRRAVRHELAEGLGVRGRIRAWLALPPGAPWR